MIKFRQTKWGRTKVGRAIIRISINIERILRASGRHDPLSHYMRSAFRAE